MAHADYTFYAESYHGDELTEANADKWLERASDYVDAITFHRTENTFPVEEKHVVKVKKAVCAIAEALFLIDAQAKAMQASMDASGTYKGAVASMSSGRESISYVQAGNSSVYGRAAADQKERDKLLYGLAVQYLADVPDSEGVNLLYVGVM